jgi:cellulose synthase/poly-beta-1,6-N-acetylglucosamine synthase-like glycosyltransferase
MIIIFYIFAVLLIYLSYRSFRSGFDYLNYFRRELAKPRSEYLPFVTIIAPCKGLDPGLAENFTGLMHQDHGEYEVLFVVDDASDPAASVIEDVWQQSNKHVKLIVAAKAVDSGQKVENLREGVIHADERSEVFVFVDSDARPSAAWLRDLIAPLADGRVGAATGYRWFVSERASFASEMRSAWNASIASALGPDSASNFCWGGSTAIRRETFERLNIRERWAGTLSDDFTLTRAVREAELPIVFVPQALMPAFGTCGLRELLEFTNRQMKITRVYAPHLWKMSLFGSAVFNLVIIAAVFLMLFSGGSMSFWAAVVTLALVSFFSIGKSWLRMRAVRLVIPGLLTAKQYLPQLTFWLPTPALFLINCLAALVSRRITWRGVDYELLSPQQTRRLD